MAPRLMLRHFVRFNLVSLIGVVVQLAALDFFNHALDFGALPATAAAVVVAVLHNFVWHERYTWADRLAGAGCAASSRLSAGAEGRGGERKTGKPRLAVFRRLLLFHLTNGAISLIGNLILMEFLMVDVLLPLLAANLASIACCALLNFAISDRWVFRAQAPSAW